MDWSKLYFGRVSPSEVQEAIKDPYWQSIRLKMKGMSLKDKYITLSNYYNSQLKISHGEAKRMLQVRVTNYVTALSRGGLIKPSDYKKE